MGWNTPPRRAFMIISAGNRAVNPTHLLTLLLQLLQRSVRCFEACFNYNRKQAWRYFSIVCGWCSDCRSFRRGRGMYGAHAPPGPRSFCRHAGCNSPRSCYWGSCSFRSSRSRTISPCVRHPAMLSERFAFTIRSIAPSLRRPFCRPQWHGWTQSLSCCGLDPVVPSNRKRR